MSPRLHAISAAVAAAIATLAAHAQEATPTKTDTALDTVEVNDEAVPFRQFRGVEVTGTAIINPTARQALPVRVIDRREIERTGASNVVQLLQRLPLMQGFTELGGYNSIGKGGYQAGAIHGYENGTLVLINGRRQAAVPLQRADLDRTAADIGLLPLSAIDRVEILTDGASSLYGSEAIAGVINIITREQTQGLRISAETSDVTTANKQGNGLGLAWGKGNLLKDRYNIQIHFSANQQDPIGVRDLPWTSYSAVPMATDANGDTLYAHNVFIPNGYPGKLLGVTETADQCPTGYEYTLVAQNRGYQGPATYACQSNPTRYLYLYPKVDNRQLHTQIEWITASQHALFAEWTRQEEDVSFLRYRFHPLTIRNSLTNQSLTIDLAHWYLMERQINTKRDRYVIGSKGLVGDWNYRLSLMVASNRQISTDEGGTVATTAAMTTTLTPYFNELLKPFEQGSPAFLQALDSLRRAEAATVKEEKNELRELKLTASRTVGETEWGDIQLAVVGFATHQRVSSVTPSSPVNNPPYSNTRRNHGLAGEIQWPALASLNITGAARAESYSDFGSVLTGKVGAKYQVNDHTFLRGSMGTGFRAPTLAQTGTNTNLQARSGARLIWAEGNPDLRPETSVQQTIGIQSTPNHNWALGLDWWQFKVDDVFGSLTVSEIDRDPLLQARYFRGGNYYIQPLNLGQLNKSGIDYNVQYRHPLDTGVLTIGLEGTHNLRSKRSLQAGQDTVSDLGAYQAAFDTVTPRNKLRLSGTIANAKIGWRAAINYQSGNTAPNPVTLLSSNGSFDGLIGTHRVRSSLTLDLGGWYQINQRLRLLWNIENITNATPPLRPYNNGNNSTGASIYPWSDTRYNDYRGRVFNARLEWQLW